VALKLGKRPFVPSPRDFTVAQLLDAQAVTLPKAPARFGHGTMFKDWGMLGNGPDPTVHPGFQGAGDCFFAGAAHETMETLKIARRAVSITGKEVISDYSAVTGYVLDDESTDQGTYVREGMSYRRKTGIVDAKGKRHQIGAFVSIDPKDFDLMIRCVYTFAAVGIGFEFPASAMGAVRHTASRGTSCRDASIEGGHYVPVIGRSSV
jgi:hypothetical protein